MTTPLSKHTLIGAAVVIIASLALAPLYPLAVASFQAGLIVGLVLHSAHVKSACENGHVEYHDQKA